LTVVTTKKPTKKNLISKIG
jgi:hypothetical protein